MQSFVVRTHLKDILRCVCALLPVRCGDVGELCDKAPSLLVVLELLLELWAFRLE
jgi:hypothetical protein